MPKINRGFRARARFALRLHYSLPISRGLEISTSCWRYASRRTSLPRTCRQNRRLACANEIQQINIAGNRFAIPLMTDFHLIAHFSAAAECGRSDRTRCRKTAGHFETKIFLILTSGDARLISISPAQIDAACMRTMRHATFHLRGD